MAQETSVVITTARYPTTLLVLPWIAMLVSKLLVKVPPRAQKIVKHAAMACIP